MSRKNPFEGRHFKSEIILLNVRWYLRYSLSYRDLEEMMLERNLEVDHTTIFRWVQRYSPEIEKRYRPHVMKTNDSWRTDETYIKIKGKWKYLYRAVDSRGNTIDFLLRAKRDKAAAKRFFQKALKAPHNVTPRVITVDKNAAYPPAIQQLKDDEVMAEACEVRQIKYLNNIIEQDHRFIKRLVRPGLGFKSFHTAWRTLRGFEAINMIRKGQIEGIEKGDIKSQVQFIEDLFPIAA